MAGNLIKKDGRYLNLAVASDIESGDPMVIGQGITGVALTDRTSAGMAAVDVGQAVFDLLVEAKNDQGSSAVALMDMIFINMNDDPVLSKKASGAFFGFAMETIGTPGAEATINVLQVPGQGPIPNIGPYIWVAPHGDDDVGLGTYYAPYETLLQGFSVMTAARKTMLLMPGTYASAASLAWPTTISDVLVTGLTPDYESTIIQATAGDEVIDIAPALSVNASNFLAFMASLYIEHDKDTNGVQIDNTLLAGGTKKLIVTFRDCGFGANTDTDSSILWVHDGSATSMIKMYMHGRGLGGNNIEGLVSIDYYNAGDRCKINGMNLEGGIEFGTQTIAAEGEFLNCVMKLNGGTGGQATQILRAIGCISKDGMTQEPAAKGEFATNASEEFLSFGT